MEKKILDPTCGGKMFWFDKGDKRVLFTDIRKKDFILCDGRKYKIDPDIQMDFRDLKFPDNSFKLVVFDPPHLKIVGDNSWLAKKYGKLENWQEDIKKGFSECFRVLEDYGILIFKWNERDIKIKEILKLADYKPLFGHTTRKDTKWICFINL